MGRFKGAMGKPLPPPHFQLKFCIQKAENYKNPLEAFYLMKKNIYASIRISVQIQIEEFIFKISVFAPNVT